MIQAPDHRILISAASVWEIATKARIGKLHGLQRLLSDFDALLDADGFGHLAIRHDHARLAGAFELPHRDPFDRMLAAQALIEEAVLLSNDAAVAAFGCETRW